MGIVWATFAQEIRTPIKEGVIWTPLHTCVPIWGDAIWAAYLLVHLGYVIRGSLTSGVPIYMRPYIGSRHFNVPILILETPSYKDTSL